MNCERGDLAMIVDRGLMSHHAAGMIVRVLEWTTNNGQSGWRLDAMYHAPNGHQFNFAVDRVLTPIRYRSGVDQMVARMRSR